MLLLRCGTIDIMRRKVRSLHLINCCSYRRTSGRAFFPQRRDMLLVRFVAMRQRPQGKSKPHLRLMSDCAAVIVEEFYRAPQMLRRLNMEFRRRRMMLCGSQAAFNGPCRRWNARMLGGDIGLVDGMQCMAVGQHRLMSGMIVILARLVILRCLPVKSRRLLVMRCGSLEMSLFTLLGIHGSSR